MYTQTEGWTRVELEAIARQSDQFVQAMLALDSPNIYLCEALCKFGYEFSNNNAFEAVAQYLSLIKVDYDWDDERYDDFFSDVGIIVSDLVAYFWDNRIDSFRENEDLLKENLRRLINWANKTHPRIGYEFLLNFQFIGRDEVISFVHELEARANSPVWRSLIQSYSNTPAWYKERKLLCQRDYLEQHAILLPSMSTFKVN
jgi:hypothetical protein